MMKRLSIAAVFALSFSLALAASASAGDYDSFVTKEYAEGWVDTLRGQIDVKADKTIRVEVTIYLLANGKFLGVYWEGVEDGYINGALTHLDRVDRYIQGTWTVKDGTLVLPGFGEGKNGSTFEFRADGAIATSDVKDKPIGLYMARISSGLDVMRRRLQLMNITPQF